MENLKKIWLENAKKICVGLLMGMTIFAGMFLDSEGTAGWLALGVCLTGGLATAVLLIRWDKKVEGDDNDD